MFEQAIRQNDVNRDSNMQLQRGTVATPSRFQIWKARKGFDILNNVSSKVGNENIQSQGYVDPRADVDNQSMRLSNLNFEVTSYEPNSEIPDEHKQMLLEQLEEEVNKVSEVISKYGCYLCELHPIDLIKIMSDSDILTLQNFKLCASLLINSRSNFENININDNLKSRLVLLYRFVNDLCYIIRSVVMGQIDQVAQVGIEEGANQSSKVSDAFRRMRAMIFLLNQEGIKFDKGLTREEGEEYLKTLRLRRLEKDMNIEERLTSASKLISVKKLLTNVKAEYGGGVGDSLNNMLKYMVSVYIDHPFENTQESKFMYIDLLEAISKECKNLIYNHPENDNMFAYMVMRILNGEFKQYGIDTHFKESTEKSEEEFRQQANSKILGNVWQSDYNNMDDVQRALMVRSSCRISIMPDSDFLNQGEYIYESESIYEKPTMTVHVNGLDNMAQLKQGHSYFQLKYNCFNPNTNSFERRNLALGLMGSNVCKIICGIDSAKIINQTRSDSDISMTKSVDDKDISRAISSIDSFLQRFPHISIFTTNCVNFVRTVANDALGSSNAFSSILDASMPAKVADNIISSTLNNISSLEDIEAGVGSYDKCGVRYWNSLFVLQNNKLKLDYSVKNFEEELKSKAGYKIGKTKESNNFVENRIYAIEWRMEKLDNILSNIAVNRIEESKFLIAAYVKEVMKAIKRALVICKDNRQLSIFLLEVNTRFRRYLKWILNF